MKYYLRNTLIKVSILLAMATTSLVVFFGVIPEQTQAAKTAADLVMPSKVLENPYQEPLEQMIEGFGAQYPETTGLYVTDLSNDAQAGYNESQSFVSASLYKLFVAYLVLDAVDSHTLTLDDTVDEVGVSIGHCLDIMITVSDNDCGVALGNLLDWQVIDSRLQQEGYTETILNNYDSNGVLIGDKVTTPSDVATLLTRLYEKNLLSPDMTDLYMKLLEEQSLDYALPTGISSNISFAHKTGILESVSHDVGFMTYEGRTLLVVMMTDGWEHAYTDSIERFTIFGELASQYVQRTYS